MLSAATDTGFAPDPVLPGRDVLLDPEAMTDRLAPLFGGGPVALVRVKYRIGESVRVVYRLGTGALVSGRAFADRAAAASAYGTARAAPGRPRVAHDDELATVWWAFPDDRRLRTLARIERAAAAALGLPHLPWVASGLLEYAPERSATFRAAAADAATVGYLKAYAPGTVDVAALAGRYAAVASALARRPDAPRTPRPLCWSTAEHLLLLDAVPGTRWADLDPDAAAGVPGGLGSALAAIHATRPPSGLTTFGRLRPDRLHRSAELVARARPDVAADVRGLAGRLLSAPPPAEPAVLLHGDCHAKNALLDGGRVGLVDLDQAGTGPAAADLGSLLARLHHDELVADRPAAPAARAALAAYADVRRLPLPAALRWHTAAALLAEQAMRAVNRVRSPTLARLDALLAVAADVLDGVR